MLIPATVTSEKLDGRSACLTRMRPSEMPLAFTPASGIAAMDSDALGSAFAGSDVETAAATGASGFATI